jgi:PIN domain nuclease of toxin-antitoxin system
MLLLDTHIAVWLATDRNQLSMGELAAIIEPSNEIIVSAVSVWELGIKWQKFFRSGERRGPMDPAEFLLALNQMGMPVLPLTAELAAARLSTSAVHGDPFDTMLLTIAQETNAKLLTRDEKLRGHPLALHAS